MREKGKQPVRVSSNLFDEREEGTRRGRKRPINNVLQQEGTNLVYRKDISSVQHFSTISESTNGSDEEAETTKEHQRSSTGVQGSSKGIPEDTFGATRRSDPVPRGSTARAQVGK